MLIFAPHVVQTFPEPATHSDLMYIFRQGLPRKKVRCATGNFARSSVPPHCVPPSNGNGPLLWSRLLSPLSCVSIHKYFSLYARPCANWTHSTQGPSRNVKGQAEQEVCVLFDGGHFESVPRICVPSKVWSWRWLTSSGVRFFSFFLTIQSPWKPEFDRLWNRLPRVH